MRPAGFEDRGHEDSQPDDEQQGDEQRPAGRSDRAELRPLRQRDTGLSDPADGRGSGRQHAHAAAFSGSAAILLASAWNSTSSRVSSMNASSSEAWSGVSSCSTIRLAAAISPISSELSPATSSTD